MRIVDSHCHLNNPNFHDVEGALQRAAAVGVDVVQTICTHLGEFPEVLNIANSYKGVYCSVGVHPLNVDDGPCSSKQIIELSRHDKVISIGETGLDYYYSKDNKKLQQDFFVQHIEAAQETGLPLVIHARDADDDIVSIMQQHMQKKKFGAVIHCFTASEWLAKECLEMGCYISAAGIITFKNAEEIRSTFMQVPLDRILVETDSPYLAPVPYRGKSNEPAFTRNTLEFLADMRGVSVADMAAQTTDNFFRLFNKAVI